MFRVFGASLFAIALATPALADKASYCQTYARDFADRQSTDKTLQQHKYQIALDACLAKKTSTVKLSKPVPPPVVEKPAATPVAPAAPKPTVVKAKPADLKEGSPAWNDYCSNKYTSFNADTGMYMSLTGVPRHCLITPDGKG